jgi:hypothetical protein
LIKKIRALFTLVLNLLVVPLSSCSQKLDFVNVRDWRAKRARCLRTRKAKKGDIVNTFKNDSDKKRDGSLQLRTYFPAGVTSEGSAIICCGTAFCKLYGMSSKTKSAYWKIASIGTELELEEASELKLAKNEGRRQETLLWMKNTFHLLCDILPTSDYSAKNYHLPKCMTKNAIHQEYWEQFNAQRELCDSEVISDFKPYSRPTFAKLWKAEFPYVCVPDHTAFSVCAHCADLHDRFITAIKTRNKELQIQIQDLRKMHLRFVGGERLIYREHQGLARDHPDKFVCLCVDGMDQAKLRGPHFAGGGIPKGVRNF